MRTFINCAFSVLIGSLLWGVIVLFVYALNHAVLAIVTLGITVASIGVWILWATGELIRSMWKYN